MTVEHFILLNTAFVGQVGDRIRKGLFYFFEALSRYDYPECAHWLNEMADKRLEGAIFRSSPMILLISIKIIPTVLLVRCHLPSR